MKNYAKNRDLIVEEIKRFRKTNGEADKQIIKVELDGIYAIMFRAVIRLCDENKEKITIKEAINIGIFLKAKEILNRAGITFT